MAALKRIVMLFSIIARGKAKRYMDALRNKGIEFHIQTTAVGTAPSEMMDIFGLGTNDKDIVVSLASEQLVDSYVTELTKNIGTNAGYGGLMMCFDLSAINRLTAELVMRANRGNSETEGEKKVKEANTNKHQLILITVNQGYTDAVMQTARKAGAMGGTVLRARLAGTERFEHFGSMVEQEEKEIVAILSPCGVAAEIMEEVNRAHGLKSEACGMIMALPVDKAYKI